MARPGRAVRRPCMPVQFSVPVSVLRQAAVPARICVRLGAELPATRRRNHRAGAAELPRAAQQ